MIFNNNDSKFNNITYQKMLSFIVDKLHTINIKLFYF